MIFRYFAWFGLMSMGIAGVLQADTVLLVNSDRLSGEIQKLEDKRLYLKTVYAGVIEIDWSMVQGITADQTLHFSMRDGRTVTGTVQGSGEGLQISALPPHSPIYPQSVKAISKPEDGETFWSRWDGTVELGYSLTRGNSNISQSSVGDRDDAQLLRLRTSIGAGLGWQALRSRRTELSLLSGLTFTEENYRVGEEVHPGLGGSIGEALFGISLERFEWRHLRFIGKSSLYRSVLDGNRIRVVANAGVRVPVIHHVVWTIRLNEQFDSRPLFSVKKHDHGLISSFGLAF